MFHLFRKKPVPHVDVRAHFPSAEQYLNDPPRPPKTVSQIEPYEHVQFSLNCNVQQRDAISYVQKKVKPDCFSSRVLKLMSNCHLSPQAFYTRAQMDRKLFSALKNGGDSYKPSRETAIRCCLALHLSLDDTDELLRVAGFSLSDTDKRDLLICYCIEHSIWDIYDVDELLHHFGQKELILPVLR